jgi:RNA polymerase sigma-70 factor (ECF subfamily)
MDPSSRTVLTEAFLVALHKQDVVSLSKLLRNDIELYNDGGGKRAAALKPLFGLEKVLKFLGGIAKLPENQDNEFMFRSAFVNGSPAALIFHRSNGELDSMQYVEFENGVITRLHYVRNPDKLKIRK